MKIFVAIALALLTAMPLHATPQRPSLLLLCDDDEMDLIIERHHLKQYHCLIDECRKAEDALVLLKKNHYDYAFLDLWLDGQMTAIDVIEECDPKNKSIIFWVLSGDWSFGVGSRMLAKTMALNVSTPYIVQAIVKGQGTPTQGDLRGFAAMLEMSTLKRK